MLYAVTENRDRVHPTTIDISYLVSILLDTRTHKKTIPHNICSIFGAVRRPSVVDATYLFIMLVLVLGPAVCRDAMQ